MAGRSETWHTIMTQAAEDFRNWIGRTASVSDTLAPAQAAAAAAMFDEPADAVGEGAILPLLWHWFYFLPRAPQETLGDDGHPALGGFMPPVPYPRRMFAGARIRVHAPLRIGRAATREAVIRDVVMKSGRSGQLAFVTVAYRFVQDGALCLEEEQDIVYREPGAPVLAPAVVPPEAQPAGAWTRTVTPDPRLLFRFSALTFNAHRIHYDREYATRVEGYPGLVVHGPLTAMLLAQLARSHDARQIRSFRFRGVAPLFDLAPFHLVALPEADSVALTAIAPDGAVALDATVELS